MRFLPDKQLYTDTDRCLAWLEESSFDAVDPPYEECHVYVHGSIGPKQTLVLKSFLATQDCDRLGLTLWIDRDDGYAGHMSSAALVPLLSHLRVRPYDPVEQSRGTPLEDRLDLYAGSEPTARSNFARLTILHNEGGIYVDADTVFLRDLHELPSGIFQSDEFCSQWSSHIRSGNNAFLRLRRGSATAVALMNRAVAESSCGARAILAFEGGGGIDLLVLPSAVSDPLWAHHDGRDRVRKAPIQRFDEFFASAKFGPLRWPVRSYRDFFRGAFAYHWHNQWNADARPGSYFWRFHREFDAILDHADPVTLSRGRSQ